MSFMIVDDPLPVKDLTPEQRDKMREWWLSLDRAVLKAWKLATKKVLALPIGEEVDTPIIVEEKK